MEELRCFREREETGKRGLLGSWDPSPLTPTVPAALSRTRRLVRRWRWDTCCCEPGLVTGPSLSQDTRKEGCHWGIVTQPHSKGRGVWAECPTPKCHLLSKMTSAALAAAWWHLLPPVGGGVTGPVEKPRPYPSLRLRSQGTLLSARALSSSPRARQGPLVLPGAAPAIHRGCGPPGAGVPCVAGQAWLPPGLPLRPRAALAWLVPSAFDSGQASGFGCCTF
ncbi:hypothetical protein HJG60_009664 [Phyllostomus discolor]|uniref:Uncharacterized protein n=1 Tax=Phyllostomus discolor TaxID=89673 RepID=A0A834BBW7_9CHIR|nr:hypothetical protein HJG60_009664 [Phyllostomus discolor]